MRDPDSKAQGGWARERALQVKVPDELLHLSAVPRSHMAEEKAIPEMSSDIHTCALDCMCVCVEGKHPHK